MTMLDEPVTIREMMTLITLVRDEKPRDPLRRLEDVMLDLYAKASQPEDVAATHCRTCGRTKAMCDDEPRRCCDVCRDNGHGSR